METAAKQCEDLGLQQLGMQICGGFPRLGVPFLGDNTVRIVVFRGLYWGTIYREITMYGGWNRACGGGLG